MIMSDKPIGVFDSGVGGLTVVREIMKQLPGEHIIYFGDTARLPYGSKSKETVIDYARQIKRFLETKDVKAIVIACNTASAHALETLQQEANVPVIGVIHAGAKTATDVTRNGRIGIIGTQGTVESKIYPRSIEKMRPGIQVFQRACPLFVPMAEEGLSEAQITEDVAHMYLDEMIANDVDTLVLGCTHYPLLIPTIKKVMGEHVTLVNPAYETARELKGLLRENGLLNQDECPREDKANEYYASDLAYKIKEFAESILPEEDINAVKVDITKY